MGCNSNVIDFNIYYIPVDICISIGFMIGYLHLALIKIALYIQFEIQEIQDVLQHDLRNFYFFQVP